MSSKLYTTTAKRRNTGGTESHNHIEKCVVIFPKMHPALTMSAEVKASSEDFLKNYRLV